VGPTLFRIPAEEIFFFIIQTYNTTLLYLLLSKPTFHPIYLCREDHSHAGARLRALRTLGQLVLVVTIIMGVGMVVTKGEGMYMGLILAWAGPFLLLLWYGTPELQMWVCLENAADGSRSLAYQFIACLPLSNTLLPVVLPTLYLWLVDTLALKRGTWVIESGTKLGFHLWDGLEIECVIAA